MKNEIENWYSGRVEAVKLSEAASADNCSSVQLGGKNEAAPLKKRSLPIDGIRALVLAVCVHNAGF